MLSIALPLRTYLSQRSEIAQAEAAQRAQSARVGALEAERKQLQDPAFVAAEARRRLHFVKPGDTPYLLITATPAPVPPGRARTLGVVVSGREGPWYSQLYGSVVAADAPQR